MAYKKRAAAVGIASALLACMLASAAGARTVQSAFLPMGTTAEAPRGFVEMCVRDHNFCGDGQLVGDSNIVTGGLAGRRSTLNALDTAPTLKWSAPPSLKVEDMLSAINLPNVALDVTPTWQPCLFPVIDPTGWTSSSCAKDAVKEDHSPYAIAIPSFAQLLAFIPASTPPTTPQAALASPAAEESPPAESKALARQEKKLLRDINRLVNDHVRQVNDIDAVGEEEYWQRSGLGVGATGDCEDIAIEKRFALIAAGFPADRLSFAVVFSRKSRLHTVLVARTADGDVVLDSRSPYVLAWHAVPYVWVSIQSMSDPMAWHRLDRTTARL